MSSLAPLAAAVPTAARGLRLVGLHRGNFDGIEAAVFIGVVFGELRGGGRGGDRLGEGRAGEDGECEERSREGLVFMVESGIGRGWMEKGQAWRGYCFSGGCHSK